MKPRYLLKPGFTDPVRRVGFVMSRALAAFYGLQEAEYVVFDPTEPGSKYMGLIELGVRIDGDYKEYRRAVDRFSERMKTTFDQAARHFDTPENSHDEVGRLVGERMVQERDKIISEGWLPAGFDATFAIGVRRPA